MGEIETRPDDTVPKGALVICPMRKGEPVRVHPTCTGCEHHQVIAELEKLTKDPRASWAQAHRIKCGFVRMLAIMEIAD